jgi:hypothetical protein
LHPPGYTGADVNDIDGSTFVGVGRLPSSSDHALLWHGTAESIVDLNPVGFRDSVANAVAGSQQAGAGYPVGDNHYHAILWSGTADSAIDLHPTGFDQSYIWDMTTSTQVGWGIVPPSGAINKYHALLWSGSAATVIDLHPPGFDSTFAYGASEDTQAGYGFGAATGGNAHALLWRGSADSVVDLHPAVFTGSNANDAAGDWQVGDAYGPTTGRGSHAMAWRGSADTAVDLHALLAQTGLSFSTSLAVGVDDSGNVIGWGDAGGGRYAIRWTLVPEPATWSSSMYAIIVLALRRRLGSARRR